MRRAVTPVLRRRRLPHLAGSRCLPNPESSPWSLYSGAGLLRGGEGVHSSDDGDSLRTVDPHRFSRNRYLPLTFPAHRTTSAHADVGKRSAVAEPAPTLPLNSSSFRNLATGFSPPSRAKGRLGRRPPPGRPEPATVFVICCGVQVGRRESFGGWDGCPGHACRTPQREMGPREESLGKRIHPLLPGRGGRLGVSPDCIPKPTSVRWIPTTAT
jgi:hypothetical protein